MKYAKNMNPRNGRNILESQKTDMEKIWPKNGGCDLG